MDTFFFHVNVKGTISQSLISISKDINQPLYGKQVENVI